MGRSKDKYTKATVTFRIGLDTDRKIESLRKHLIQKTGVRSLFGGTPIKATRSQMVEQGVADLWQRKSNEYENPDNCGYCKQSYNSTDLYNSAVEELERYINLYNDMKKLYSTTESGKHGQKIHPAKDKQPKS